MILQLWVIIEVLKLKSTFSGTDMTFQLNAQSEAMLKILPRRPL